MRYKMEISYTKKREYSQPVVRRETGPQPRHASQQSHQMQSFFNAPLLPQPINQNVLRLEPGVVILMAALVKELHTQNEIELAKLKRRKMKSAKRLRLRKKKEKQLLKNKKRLPFLSIC